MDSIIDLSVPTDKASIAVLPFVNMSGDPEQEYFSDGITEEIITALSKVPDILVIARNSTFTYKGKAVNVKQVGKELGVKYVLEGSVRKSGNRIRATAQLIDAETGNHKWADRYDRDLEDIFAIQDEITTRILEELSIRLWHDVKARLVVKGTDKLEAYLKYWQGMEYLGRFNKNDTEIALHMFEEVIKLDPNWGLAYAFLGMCYHIDFLNGWSNSRQESIRNAMEYAKKAISLDNTLPDPYLILSNIYLYKRRYEHSIFEAEKSIKVQPNFFIGYQALGLALTYSGNFNKAIDMLKQAIRLSPKFPMVKFHLGVCIFNIGQYSEAIPLFKIALEQAPDYFRIHAYITAAYVLEEMVDIARKQAQEILRIDPDFLVDGFADHIPYKNQSDTDRILNALRKAGLK